MDFITAGIWDMGYRGWRWRGKTSKRGGDHTAGHENWSYLPTFGAWSLLGAWCFYKFLTKVSTTQHRQQIPFPLTNGISRGGGERSPDRRNNLRLSRGGTLVGCSNCRDMRYAGWQWNGEGRRNEGGIVLGARIGNSYPWCSVVVAYID